MEKWEIRPPLSQKPLNRSSPKFEGDYVGNPYPYAKFHHDTIAHFVPPNMRKCMTRLVFWFFLLPTAKTPAPIFTIYTSNDVVSSKDVPFGGPKKITFRCYFPPKRKFLANFDET